MADLTFISDVQVAVSGGPSQLSVSVDRGEQGVRGSKIWWGYGNPATTLVGQSINLSDLYINARTSDQYYSWVYIYELGIGNVPVWNPVLKLNPTQYSSITAATFSAGASTVLIPLSSITSTASPNLANFIITYNIESSVPIASGFVPTINGTNLQLVFAAQRYASSTWSPLTGSNKIHLTIAYLG